MGFEIIEPGPNVIQVLPAGSPAEELVFETFQLSSGPISAFDDAGVIPEPCALGLIGLAVFAVRRRRR